MSISRSYNKQNNTYYAYETQYIYDEAKQRKVQKRRCIGKVDPETNEIIPTGKRGRPSKKHSHTANTTTGQKQALHNEIIDGMTRMSLRLNSLESMISGLSSELNSVKTEYDGIMKRLSENKGH